MLKIFCDFDNTITNIDTTDHLLGKFADKKWLELEQLYKNNLISAKVCLEKQISLLNVSIDYLNSYIKDSIQISEGFLSFVKMCKNLNYDVVIVSDGLDVVIKIILKLYNISYIPFFSNKVTIEEKSFNLSFPFSKEDCKANLGCCKCTVVRQHSNKSYKVVYVGDGISDYCVSKNYVDFVFAKDKLLNYCKKFNIVHCEYKNFFDIKKNLPLLLNVNSEI